MAGVEIGFSMHGARPQDGNAVPQPELEKLDLLPIGNHSIPSYIIGMDVLCYSSYFTYVAQ